MSKLRICRICLASEVQMYVIEDTKFQVIYEKLCFKLQTEDDRPLLACYLCYSQLRKCHKLMIKAKKSEDLLTGILKPGIKLTESIIKDIDRKHYKLAETLSLSSIKFSNVVEHYILQDVDIKEELIITEEVDIKEEADIKEKADTKEEADLQEEVDSKKEAVIKKELLIKGEDIDYETDNTTEESDSSDTEEEEEGGVFKTANNVNHSSNETESEDEMPLLSINHGKDKVDKLAEGPKSKKNIEDKEKPLCAKGSKTNVPENISTKEPQRKLKKDKTLNRPDDPYNCEKCKKSYATLKSYKNHRHQRKKVNGKPYSCAQCDYKCARQESLIRHSRQHSGEKPYKCTLCEYKTTENSLLKIHIMRKHTKEKPYSCTQCDYKCSETGDLKRHMRKHTGEKPYSCNSCDYKCSENTLLKVHKMRKHTREKPHSCKLCDYKCIQYRDLTRHLRIHTGEKPYSCKLCNYQCTQTTVLKAHIISKHTKEKPYSCTMLQSFGSDFESLEGPIDFALPINYNRKIYRRSVPNDTQFSSHFI